GTDDVDVGVTDRDGDRHELEHRGDRGPLPDAEVRLVCWIRADCEDPSQHHGTDSSTGDPSRDGLTILGQVCITPPPWRPPAYRDIRPNLPTSQLVSPAISFALEALRCD